MSEHPILFSGPMEQAVLDGTESIKLKVPSDGSEAVTAEVEA